MAPGDVLVSRKSYLKAQRRAGSDSQTPTTVVQPRTQTSQRNGVLCPEPGPSQQVQTPQAGFQTVGENTQSRHTCRGAAEVSCWTGVGTTGTAAQHRRGADKRAETEAERGETEAERRETEVERGEKKRKAFGGAAAVFSDKQLLRRFWFSSVRMFSHCGNQHSEQPSYKNPPPAGRPRPRADDIILLK